MNAETVSIIVSMVAVGATVGTLAMTGIKQVRQDMDRRFTELRDDMHSDTREIRRDLSEVRHDVNSLREAVGGLKEAVATLKDSVGALKERGEGTAAN